MKNLFLKSLILCCLSTSTFARWLSPQEADVEFSENEEIQLNEDTTYTNIVDVEMKILNETARTTYGSIRLNYSPKNEKFKILEAESTFENITIKVKASDIVDTAVNATENGFDENRQIVVPFSDVKVNSVLHYKLERKVHKPAIDHHFSDLYYIGNDAIHNKFQVKIRSPQIIYYSKNDPQSLIEVTENKTASNKYEYTFKLKHPVFFKIANEIRSYLPAQENMWLIVSTQGSYQEMLGDLNKKFQARLSEELPELFQNIANQAKEKFKDKSIDQINQVLALQSEIIRYMGDWRGVEGAVVPHKLAEIAESRYGDCKDMALVTTKILRTLGYDANVAVVWRGPTAPVMSDIPYFSFNHAIVHVQFNSKDLWLDPTNFQSFADIYLNDISERKAYLISSEHPSLKYIPSLDSKLNIATTSLRSKFKTPTQRFDQIQHHVTGFLTLKDTGIELSRSKNQIEEDILIGLVDPVDLIHYKFEPYDLKSRIAKPITFKLELERVYHPVITSMGNGMTVHASPMLLDILKVDIKNRESYLFLDVPSKYDVIAQISNLKIKGNKFKNCKIQSPWINYTFQVEMKKTKLTNSVEILKPWITKDEIHSPIFEKFQKQLLECAQDQILIYSL